MDEQNVANAEETDVMVGATKAIPFPDTSDASFVEYAEIFEAPDVDPE